MVELNKNKIKIEVDEEYYQIEMFKFNIDKDSHNKEIEEMYCDEEWQHSLEWSYYFKHVKSFHRRYNMESLMYCHPSF